MLSPPLWREQDTRGGSHLSHHGSWYASEHTEEELLQLKDCATANPKPQETRGVDHSWQASRRTEYIFTGFLVSEPWQTRCIFTLLLCSGLLCLSSVFFFFFNQKASLYLLAFSKLHLPGMMRKCVRHGITRSKLGAGFIHSLERSVLARGHSANSVHTHLLTELTSNRLLSKRTPQSPLQSPKSSAEVAAPRGVSCWVPWYFPPPLHHPLTQPWLSGGHQHLFGSCAGLDVTSPQEMLLVSCVSEKHVLPCCFPFGL